jgi:hypothetical protein
MRMPNLPDWVTSFIAETRKLVTEVRKRTISGLKTIVLITMSIILVACTLLSAQAGAPYWALDVSAFGFVGILYFILQGCVKLDRTKKMRDRY